MLAPACVRSKASLIPSSERTWVLILALFGILSLTPQCRLSDSRSQPRAAIRSNSPKQEAPRFSEDWARWQILGSETMISKRMFGLAASAAAALALAAGIALTEPVKIRVGHGAAAEEQLWLMKAMPEITPQQGKAYSLEFSLFPGTDKRFQAYEAGALDAASGTGHSVLFAA